MAEIRERSDPAMDAQVTSLEAIAPERVRLGYRPQSGKVGVVMGLAR
jgi:hypothetical protein